MRLCPQCGLENPDRARFCMNCSATLPEQNHGARVRKTVTVLFCDMTGSTSLGEKLDPESVGRVMKRYYQVLRGVIEHHGGTVAKFIGDAVMAVFGIPTVHEDDALRAVRAAAEIPRAIALLNESLEREIAAAIQVRVGVNTGEVVAGDPGMGDSLITGDPVNVAARLEQAAEPEEILIGADTYWLVRDAVEADELSGLEVRGKSKPLRAFRLRLVKPGIAGHKRRLDSPMVGRERQRRLLRQIFDAVRQDRSCHLFTLLGAAGVGKSRLLAEVVRESGEDATILQGRCLSYGDGITFWPIVEILRQASGVSDGDTLEAEADKIRAFVRDGNGRLMPMGFADSPDVYEPLLDLASLHDSPTTNEQRSWAIRRLFEEMGRHRPLIVAFDDIHWAEPALLDMLEYIADWARDTSLLLLCMARPELLGVRPGWGGGKFNATTILLEPLSSDESTALVRNLLQDGDLPPDVLSRILAAAEGNPLFLEEMLGMLIDEGTLERLSGRWIAGDVSHITVPPTIHALIAARLDRLERDERVVIERASVIGKGFDLRSLANLLPEELRTGLSYRVMALVRKDLLRPGASGPGGDGYLFRHLLIQEAAYGGIPKEARARLHRQYADWLEQQAPVRMQEFEEIVGHHLEQAARYLGELGIDRDLADDYRRRAAERLGSAGIRAYGRADAAAAESLLAKSTALLPTEDARRVELLPFLGAARGDRGNLGGAVAAYREAMEISSRLDRDDVRWHAEIALEHLRLATDPLAVDARELLAKAEQATAALRGSGNDLALALAWFLVVLADHRLGRFEAAAQAAMSARAHARSARQPRQEADACGLEMVSRIYGTLPLSGIAERAQQLLQEAAGNPLMATWAIGDLGVVQLLSGRPEEGRTRMAAARQRVEEMGLEFAIPSVEVMQADCEMAAGNVAEAEALYRRSLGLFAKIGDEGAALAVAGALARALVLKGELDAAERYLQRDPRGPVEGLTFRTRWQPPRAPLLARRGDLHEAKALALQWKDHVEGTEGLLHRADAWMDLADVLRLDGDAAAAQHAARQAIALYRRKGSAVDVERAVRWGRGA